MTSLLDLITPTNLDAEREKFFSSPTYCPTFHYLWQDQPTSPNFSIKLKYPLWEAIKVQDHAGIMEAAKNLFEVEIDEPTLDRALAASAQEGELAEGSLEEIKNLFESAFKEFDLDYKVRISHKGGFNLRPNHEAKELVISDQIHFEYFSMEAEVRHEMTHIIRAVNGKHNKIKRSQQFLPTEEGLATWCQDHTNSDLSQVQHAMEYVGSAVGIGSGLREVYECFLAMGMSKELAWKRATRHKFGFVDTMQPGDILKPAMYYANAEKISKLSQDEKLRLFVGKISLGNLTIHPNYSGLWPAEKIIEYFKL